MYVKKLDRLPIAIPTVNELRILPPCPLLGKHHRDESEYQYETSPVLLNLNSGESDTDPKKTPDTVILDAPEAGILHRSQRERIEDWIETPSESVEQVELAVNAIRRDRALPEPTLHTTSVCDAQIVLSQTVRPIVRLAVQI